MPLIKAVRLDVSEPSHCALLQPVADALKKSLQAMRLQQPKMVYMGNVLGRALRNAEAISADLASNIAHGVRWQRSWRSNCVGIRTQNLWLDAEHCPRNRTAFRD